MTIKNYVEEGNHLLDIWKKNIWTPPVQSNISDWSVGKREKPKPLSPIYPLKSIKINDRNEEIEGKINLASIRLQNMRNRDHNISISEKIWDYSKRLVLNISNGYWNNEKKVLPLPEFDFDIYGGSVVIEWEKDEFKLVIDISDDEDYVNIYLRQKQGKHLSEPVPKSRVLDWVFLWLNHIYTS